MLIPFLLLQPAIEIIFFFSFYPCCVLPLLASYKIMNLCLYGLKKKSFFSLQFISSVLFSLSIA